MLAVDVPGFGHSAPLPAGTRPTIEAMADALERALDAAGWDKAHIGGNSMAAGWRSNWAAAGALQAWSRSPRPGCGPSASASTRATRSLPARGRDPDRSLRRQLMQTALGRTHVMGGVTARPWQADPADAAEALKLFADVPGWQTRSRRSRVTCLATSARSIARCGSSGLPRHAAGPAPGRPLRARDPERRARPAAGARARAMGDDPTPLPARSSCSPTPRARENAA